MGIQNDYELGYEIEGPLKHHYTEAAKRIRESNNSKECLENLCLIFNILEKSRPDTGEGFNWRPEKDIKWARDIIETYRNVGELFKTFKEKYDSQLNKLKEIDRIISDNSDVLDALGTKNDPDYKKIESALFYLEDLGKVFEDRGITSIQQLADKLESLDKMIDNSKRLDILEIECESFEREFS